MDVTHVDLQILYLFLKMTLYSDEDLESLYSKPELIAPVSWNIVFEYCCEQYLPEVWLCWGIHTHKHTHSHESYLQ